MDLCFDPCQTSDGWALFLVGVQLQHSLWDLYISLSWVNHCLLCGMLSCMESVQEIFKKKKKKDGHGITLGDKDQKNKSFRQTTIDPVN